MKWMWYIVPKGTHGSDLISLLKLTMMHANRWKRRPDKIDGGRSRLRAVVVERETESRRLRASVTRHAAEVQHLRVLLMRQMAEICRLRAPVTRREVEICHLRASVARLEAGICCSRRRWLDGRLRFATSERWPRNRFRRERMISARKWMSQKNNREWEEALCWPTLANSSRQKRKNNVVEKERKEVTRTRSLIRLVQIAWTTAEMEFVFSRPVWPQWLSQNGNKR